MLARNETLPYVGRASKENEIENYRPGVPSESAVPPVRRIVPHVFVCVFDGNWGDCVCTTFLNIERLNFDTPLPTEQIYILTDARAFTKLAYALRI